MASTPDLSGNTPNGEVPQDLAAEIARIQQITEQDIADAKRAQQEDIQRRLDQAQQDMEQAERDAQARIAEFEARKKTAETVQPQD